MSGICVLLGICLLVGGLIWFGCFDRPYKAVLLVLGGAALVGLGFFLSPIEAAVQMGAW